MPALFMESPSARSRKYLLPGFASLVEIRVTDCSGKPASPVIRARTCSEKPDPAAPERSPAERRDEPGHALKTYIEVPHDERTLAQGVPAFVPPYFRSMFLRPLLALALLTISFVAHAQVVAWAAPVGYGVSKAVAVDAQGNVYACGNANTQVDFDPGPGEALSPAGSGVNGDIYVVKYSNDGDYLWHYLVGGSGTEIAKNVAVDGNGDVLVTGYFSSYFDWDMGPDTVAPGTGNYDCFVLKLSSAGQFQWLQRITGPGEDQDHGLAVDAANNVYVTGMTSAT
jgi:hypothetical protein